MANYSYAYASNHDECNFFSEKYFQINNCGALKVIKKEGGVSLRDSRKDYMLLYLFEGNGWAETKGVRHRMNQGDLLFLQPGAPLNFGFEFNSMHFWIHFTGSAVNDIFSECGITETGIYKIGVNNDLWEILTDIYLHHSFNSNGTLLQANGLFLNFLGEVAEILNPGYSQKEIKREKKIYPALKDMKINFDKNYKLEHYAALCGISLSNFQHSFTKITGVTPQKYLVSIRIDIAKKLLLSSKVTIKEVAFSVGYEDPLYFSRLFKKATGLSPKEYVQKSKKSKSYE